MSDDDRNLASATARYNALETEIDWYAVGYAAGQEERTYCSARCSHNAEQCTAFAEEYGHSVTDNTRDAAEVRRGWQAGWQG